MIVKDVLVKPITLDGTQLATKARSILQKKKTDYLLAMEKGLPVGIVDLKHVIKLKEKKSNIQCRSLAERIRVIVAPDLPILDAARLLRQSDSSVGVVMERRKFRGVIDYRTLLKGFIKANYSPVKKNISDLTLPNLSIGIQATTEGVLRKLQQYPAVAVLKKKEVIGVISRADFLIHNEFRKGGKHLGEVTTSPPIVTSPSASVPDAATLMIKRGLSILPVTDGKYFLGAVTLADMVSAYVG